MTQTLVSRYYHSAWVSLFVFIAYIKLNVLFHTALKIHSYRVQFPWNNNNNDNMSNNCWKFSKKFQILKGAVLLQLFFCMDHIQTLRICINSIVIMHASLKTGHKIALEINMQRSMKRLYPIFYVLWRITG